MRQTFVRSHIYVAAIVAFSAAFGLFPTHAFASTQIFLTATTSSSWTVPSDWNSASNTIEVIGAGGGTQYQFGGGGGGGAYSEISNLSLTPGGSVSYQVGDGTALASTTSSRDTWFSSTGTVLAKGGTKGGAHFPSDSVANGNGGAASSGVGTTKYSGGQGGGFSSGGDQTGGGGGGAAGPHGGGGNGHPITTEGNIFGGDGDAGYGGSLTGSYGEDAGAAGAEWGSYGSGSGGNGNEGSIPNVDVGGAYGGGAGGNGGFGTGPSNFAAGGMGLIVITYTPAPPTCTLSVSHPTVPQGATIALSWTTTGATSASIDNSIGSVATGTAATTTVPTTTTTYTLSVSGAGGSDDCTATVTVDADKIVFLASGSSWTVPDDWNNASNTVEAIGGGGSNATTGGGGGAYAMRSDVSLTPGGSVSYHIGDIGSGDTHTSFSTAVYAAGGSGQWGGQTEDSVGDLAYSGGDGNSTKGGGAAGPNGAGGGGGTGGTFGFGGGDGDAGYGGLGADGASNGANGTEWDALHGSGGAGGASASFGGGSGGLYGAGGAFNFGDSPGSGVSAPGLIVITYTPAPVSCTLTGTPSTIAQGATAGLAWTTTSATSASLDNGIGSVSTGSGSATTTATTTTTYTMTVSGPSGSDTCSATVTFDNDKIVFLTSGTSWTVPDDWNNASNTVEVIGAGGASDTFAYQGGGGYSKKSNVSLTPGGSTSYQVGIVSIPSYATNNTSDTWFSSTSVVMAKGSADSSHGGLAADGVGDVKYSGGAQGGGGGGAAGPHGDGADGDASLPNGGAADAGYGGTGGLGAAVSHDDRNGGNGTEWDALHGAGGGGGYNDSFGGCGGLYGGGGSASPEGQGCTGAQGLVVITYTPLTTPGTPGTPTYSGTTATSTTVNWSAAAGASTYKVERCTNSGCSSYSQIASGVSGTSYNDSGTLTGNTTYGYRVRATNTYGDGSYSSGSEVTTLPDVPGTPSFSSTTSTGTTVSWSAPTGGASTYKVERCAGTGCSSFTQIASGVSGTSYNDTGTLSPNTTYRYHVRGTNAAGDGLYSAGAEVTTPPNAATCTLSANPGGVVSGGSSTLSWTTTDASSASIDNGIGSVSTGSGSTSVTPSATTLYTLTVSGTGGGGSCSATVSVSRSAATFFGGHVLINGSHIYIR